MAYNKFAEVYDELMNDVPYDLWLAFFDVKRKQYFPSDSSLRILDLGCGTGTISMMLANTGYDVTGVDLSSEMLSIAQQKAQTQKLSISFFQQNMTELRGFEPFDCVVIFCDSLNYLESEHEVKQTFESVHHVLKPSGLLLFDVHSIHKMNNIFMNQTFASNEDHLSFIWHCFPGEYSNSVEHDLSFFVKENNVYHRFDELHFQRTFSKGQYESWLKEANFDIISISSDFKENEQTEEEERIFFTCQKKNPLF